MKHIISLLNGEAVLLSTLLTLPEQYKDTSELLRASHILSLIEIILPEDRTKLDSWAKEKFKDIELTEAQRDLIKKVISTKSDKIPPSFFAIKLLEQFGFTQ